MNDKEYTPRFNKVLDMARSEATKLGHTYVGTEHLLLALLSCDDCIAVQAILNCCGISRKKKTLTIETFKEQVLKLVP